MKILIAEDQAISRKLLESNLRNWGYDVVATTNGAEAWAEFHQPDAPNLAILDILMPEMSGLEICQKLRQQTTSTPPYLILLTAKKEKADVVKGIEAGANDYLVKPFHRDELRVRVRVGARLVELQHNLAVRAKELEAALAQVKQLQGILPICPYCKKIRDGADYWHQVDRYISKHTDTQFSH